MQLLGQKTKKNRVKFMSNDFIKIYEKSIKQPEEFWQKISEDIFWFKNQLKY